MRGVLLLIVLLPGLQAGNRLSLITYSYLNATLQRYKAICCKLMFCCFIKLLISWG